MARPRAQQQLIGLMAPGITKGEARFRAETKRRLGTSTISTFKDRAALRKAIDDHESQKHVTAPLNLSGLVKKMPRVDTGR